MGRGRVQWTSEVTYQLIQDLEQHPDMLYSRTPSSLVNELDRMTVDRCKWYMAELSNTVNPNRSVYNLGPSYARNRQMYWWVKRGGIVRILNPSPSPENLAVVKYFSATMLGRDTLTLFNNTHPNWWEHAYTINEVDRGG